MSNHLISVVCSRARGRPGVGMAGGIRGVLWVKGRKRKKDYFLCDLSLLYMLGLVYTHNGLWLERFLIYWITVPCGCHVLHYTKYGLPFYEVYKFNAEKPKVDGHLAIQTAPNLSAPRPLYYRGVGCIPASTVFLDTETLSELYETNRLHSWPEKIKQEPEFSPIPHTTQASLPRV